MAVDAESFVSMEAGPWEPRLPRPRGPLSDLLFSALVGEPDELGPAPAVEGDPLSDDDLHLALYVCYELHYRGFRGVDERWEWDPSLIAFRSRLEGVFEAALKERFSFPEPTEPQQTTTVLSRIANTPAPSLSRYLRDKGTLSQFKEFLVHRSPYQLKEADPHAWVIPRLEGRPKAALVEVEFDEFGCGKSEQIHATLFGNSMVALGLDARYGAYLDWVPGETLAPVNLMSFFGLHRRLRGALVGHLAITELTSSLPNKALADGLRRLGYGRDATHFFDEHVIADSIHDMIALHDLAGGLAEQDPSLAQDVVFGASAWTGIDGLFVDYVLKRFKRQESSLLPGAALD
jgi:hypothetical protein